ncbi:uncharacterized protein LOC113475732 [Ciona intestinalis]
MTTLLSPVSRSEHSPSIHKRVGVTLTSSLYRIDPFVDNDGVLRVGGRLRLSNLKDVEKHPAILPRKGHITELIIRTHHKDVNHMGRGITHDHIRQSGYWIIGGSSAVAYYISQCITCRRTRRPPETQRMADLPVDRTEESPPFTYSAVDFFGPFYIKERRSILKRYGVVFTCMASRAVHLESANSLDTSSFINSLRRFLCRRGAIKQLRSDQGTNFVGARNELHKCLSELDGHSISKFLLQHKCDWFDNKFNPPMPAIWVEHGKQIRTIRGAMKPILLQSEQLDDEAFRTLLVEVENIVNSRPLTTTLLNDAGSPEPLTPNHILTLKPKVLLPPPGNFQRADLYCRSRWRRVQHLANEFWSRWRKEFLLSLQQRPKWAKSRPNLKVGDVALVVDENLSRNLWKMGRIVEASPSGDKLIRHVRVMICHVANAKRNLTQTCSILERPVHKLILLNDETNE